MFLIERVSTKIGYNVASYLNMDKDHEEILIYGAITLLQTLFSISLIMIFGFIFQVFWEALILSFAVSILRKYSGGLHSASPNRCAIIGAIISVSFSKAIVFISRTVSFTSIILLITIGLIYSSCFIHKYAPVDSPAKPINNILKRQYLKKYSIMLVGIMYSIIGLLLVFYKISANSLFLIDATCIAIGTVWQTFTLTHFGYDFLHKLDSFFIKFPKEELK